MPRTAGNDRNEPPPAIAFSAPASSEAMSSHACGQVGLRCMLRSFYFAGIGQIRSGSGPNSGDLQDTRYPWSGYPHPYSLDPVL